MKIKPDKIKKDEIVRINWEKKKFIKTQAIDYIKKMQLKSKELPFCEIILKTGIDRNDLEIIVTELIMKKEVNAQVRDFISIFKEISKDNGLNVK